MLCPTQIRIVMKLRLFLILLRTNLMDNIVAKYVIKSMRFCCLEIPGMIISGIAIRLILLRYGRY